MGLETVKLSINYTSSEQILYIYHSNLPWWSQKYVGPLNEIREPFLCWSGRISFVFEYVILEESLPCVAQEEFMYFEHVDLENSLLYEDFQKLRAT